MSHPGNLFEVRPLGGLESDFMSDPYVNNTKALRQAIQGGHRGVPTCQVTDRYNDLIAAILLVAQSSAAQISIWGGVREKPWPFVSQLSRNPRPNFLSEPFLVTRDRGSSHIRNYSPLDRVGARLRRGPLQRPHCCHSAGIVPRESAIEID